MLLQRRADVQKLVDAGAPVHLDPAVLCAEAKTLAGDAWTEKQSKECQRQEKVLKVRHLEAAAQSHLLDDELQGDSEQQVQLLFAAEDKNREARDRLQDRMAQRLARPDFNLYGHTVVCAPGLFTENEQAAIRLKHHMRPGRGDDVDVCVVPDVAEVHPAVKLAACLQGTMIGNPVFFATGGKQGCAVTFLPAIRTQRFIYMSYDFKVQHPQCSAVLTRVLQGSRLCKWKQLDTLASWLEHQIAAPKKASLYWALLGDSEKSQQPALAAHRYACTLDMFLRLVNGVDYSKSALGIGLST